MKKSTLATLSHTPDVVFNISNIFVVIPVHNRKDFTRSCLMSLRQQTFTDFTIIVVDDGSTDGTGEMIANEFPYVQVLKGNGNLWWTGGINLGISKALEQHASYILTMNDDTEVPPDFMHNMVRWAEVHPKALLGAFEKDLKNHQPLYAGQQLQWPYLKSTKLLKTLPSSLHHGLHEIKVFHGRGLWIPSTVFATIGLFDSKRFPHYIADFDFTLNAHKAGFKLFCNFDSIVYSYPDESGEKKIKHKKSLYNFYQHLFGRRGGANLFDYTNFVLKNCPKYIIPIELTMGYIRRIIGFWNS